MPVSASITCSKMRLREHHPINEVDFFPFCMAVCACVRFLLIVSSFSRNIYFCQLGISLLGDLPNQVFHSVFHF